MAFYEIFEKRKITKIGQKLYKYLLLRIVNIVKKYCRTGSSILEIGPGEGIIASELIKEGFSYKCYEPSPGLYAKLLNKEIDVSKKFVPPISEKDISIGSVIMVHVLEHMDSYSKALELVKEIHRVLINGGTIFIIAPDYLDLKEKFFDVDYTHNFITSTNRIRLMLMDNGFKIAEIKYFYGPFPHYIGVLINSIIKFAFLFINLIFGEKILRYSSIYKAQFTFRRSFLIIAKKNL